MIFSHLHKADEEAVIAASKQVASATAQLVAACRSKSDPNAPSQQVNIWHLPG
jgi:hypothetical protein